MRLNNLVNWGCLPMRDDFPVFIHMVTWLSILSIQGWWWYRVGGGIVPLLLPTTHRVSSRNTHLSLSPSHSLQKRRGGGGITAAHPLAEVEWDGGVASGGRESAQFCCLSLPLSNPTLARELVLPLPLQQDCCYPLSLPTVEPGGGRTCGRAISVLPVPSHTFLAQLSVLIIIWPAYHSFQ